MLCYVMLYYIILYYIILYYIVQYSEKGEVLLRGVLALRFVSHTQPARLWKAVFFIYNLLMIWQSIPKVVPRSRISRSASPFS